MNIGDIVTVPDGRTGTVVRVENNVVTIVFKLTTDALTQTLTSAFNQADVTPTKK